MVRFAPAPQQSGSGSGFAVDTDGIRSSPTKAHVVVLSRSGISTSLRWIGYEVYGWGIKFGEIMRSGSDEIMRSDSDETAHQSQKGVKMIEKTESASPAVLKREGMDVFEDVAPNLAVF